MQSATLEPTFTALFALELELQGVAQKEARALHARIEAKAPHKRLRVLYASIPDIAHSFGEPIQRALLPLLNHQSGKTYVDRLKSADGALIMNLREQVPVLSRIVTQTLCEGHQTDDAGWCAPTWACNSIGRRLVSPPLIDEGKASERETSELLEKIGSELWNGIRSQSLKAFAHVSLQGAVPERRGHSLNREPGRHAFIRFGVRKGAIVAVTKPTDEQLLKTYESLSATLQQVRAMVLKNGNPPSVEELKAAFSNSLLKSAADDSDWQAWAGPDGFANRKHTAKGVALCLLEARTGILRTTIETRCSRARAEKGRPK